MERLNQVDQIVEEVVKRIQAQTTSFEVEASGRHIHLSRGAVD